MNTELHPVRTIRNDLSTATSLLHRRVEARLPFATTDVAVYRRTLQAYYGFYRPLERMLADSAPRVSGIDWPQRIKAPALRRDLRILGLTSLEIDSLPQCQTLPHLHSEAQTLGLLYVIEGATLGGQALRELIKTNLGLDTDTGAGFMDVYGGNTHALWRAFLTRLSDLRGPRDTEQAVATAQQAFICFETWLEASEVLL